MDGLPPLSEGVTTLDRVLAGARSVVNRAQWEEPGRCIVPAWLIDALETALEEYDNERKETAT